MPITIDSYFCDAQGQDRRAMCAREYKPEYWHNAALLLTRVNALESCYLAQFPSRSPYRKNSGWRPPTVNAATPGAAKISAHMTAQALDIDDDDGLIDDWLLSAPGQAALTKCELWHEHPSTTKGWAHVQSYPPASGRRTFYA
jgi:hypothetical protein